MVEIRHLKNAPINEAIIDFRVRLPVDYNIQKVIGDIKKGLPGKYSKVETGKRVTSSVKIENGIPKVEAYKDEEIRGYRFKSSDKKDVAQFRVDGFTFSRLRPYTKWEIITGEARKLWELYCSIIKPIVLERISVHYINRIDISGKDDLVEYFTASPVLPEKLPHTLSEFFNRLVVHEKDLAACIIQTIVKSPKPEAVGIILDIEVFKESTKGIRGKSIWSTMNRMRELKNRVFFELITEKTVRLFE